MSTRRARIKGVASLPVRRKNAESTENTKPKPSSPGQEAPTTVESIAKTPQATKASPLVEKTASIVSPDIHNKAKTPVKSPRTIACSDSGKTAPKVLTVQDNFESQKVPLPKSPSHQLSEPAGSHDNSVNSPVVVGQNVSKNDEVLKTPASKKIKVTQPLSGISKIQSSYSGSTLRSILQSGGPIKRVEFNTNHNEQVLPLPRNHEALDGISKIPAPYPTQLIRVHFGSRQSAARALLNPDDTVDGIVPLESARKVAKPVDVLKSEIISETAEVLFDPIVPLPSPSKVRPKLRPVPRLAPLRRNSIQGSASESEEERGRSAVSGTPGPVPARQRHHSQSSLSTHSHTMRDTNRTRNDSVCSAVSQSTAQTQALNASPLKEKHLQSRSRRSESSRRVSALRRKLRVRGEAPRDTLTMYDLIFYNPPSNPIKNNEEANDKEEEEVKEKEEQKPNPVLVKKKLEEEDADDPGAPAPPNQPPPAPPDQPAPVPQIKLGPNGEIILDEKSLVIETTESSTRQLSASVVREGDWALGGAGRGGRYTRAPRTADWSDAETVRFYRALAAVGTDFSLMLPLFPGRVRRDIKLKFKKEERANSALIDKALTSSVEFDLIRLQGEFTRERKEAEERRLREETAIKNERQAQRDQMRSARSLGVKLSRASKGMSGVLPRNKYIPPPDRSTTANELLAQAIQGVPKRTRKRKDLSPRTEAPKEKAPSTYANTTPSRPEGTPELAAEPPGTRAVSAPTPLPAPSVRITPHKSEALRTLQALSNQPGNINLMSMVPKNVEVGSLVVLTITDPKEPTKKMLQTYVADGHGQLTPVALSPAVLGSVMSYMKRGTPTTPSSLATSPGSAGSLDSRPARNRLNSYSITPLE